MKPITLNIEAWPYIGQPLTERWKEKGIWKEKKGYILIAIHPATDYTGVNLLIMNPKGILFETSYYFLNLYYVWEEKGLREPKFKEAK